MSIQAGPFIFPRPPSGLCRTPTMETSLHGRLPCFLAPALPLRGSALSGAPAAPPARLAGGRACRTRAPQRPRGHPPPPPPCCQHQPPASAIPSQGGMENGSTAAGATAPTPPALLPRLAFVGSGNMARAIAAGVLAAGRATPAAPGGLPPSALYACNRSAGGRDAMAALGVPADHLYDSAAGMLAALNGDSPPPPDGAAPDIVVLAVKPQGAPAVLAELAPLWAASPPRTLLSVVAGMDTATLAGRLTPPGGGSGDAAAAAAAAAAAPPRVVRAMPNVAAAVGRSTTTVSAGADVPPADVAAAAALLSAVGTVEVLPEGLQDAATALAGTAPSWVALWVEALADAGVAAGLPRDAALRLAVGGVGGAAALLDGGGHPAVVRNAVESPGGVTIAGVLALERGGVRAAVADAVAVSVAKSAALGKDC
ncbi:hypothetical protein I4F81_011941 [Pyropia yezoensis]|uniref:Uncharacterized protein n=1 Tax=Pyropia yezoensis TaxID=2788 RepID=A0ACC3CHP6_PYRYE|nr:hypothetical protein I4F81_011941 [Neopyropia yezoensis]